MNLTFWGAAQTVTGSAHLVELENGKKLLLDCGLKQGRRAEADAQNRRLPFEAASIDAVVLSHAHIDHSGLLPKLYRDGFRGPIYATHATHSLCGLLLPDSAYIQEKDIEFVNKRHQKRGEPPVEPLYSQEDAQRVLERFVALPYDMPFHPVEGATAEFRDAGHILGSASISLTVQEGGREKRLGFTGDVGNPGRPILRDPQKMLDCDYVISESTYGGEVHPPAEDNLGRLAEVIARTSNRGGKVIVPSFAVGRTQELVHALDQLANDRRLPTIPMFVDSPLAVNATSVYMAHQECYDEELRRYLLRDDNPFGFDRLTYIREASRSKALNESKMPMLIISASGMCEAGRILHHLRNNIENPNNTILIVGYCAEHTLGKKIVDRHPVVNIFGDPFNLRAEVVVMNSYSAHADEPGLLHFLGMLDRQRLQRVFLVHGEPARQQKFAAALGREGYTGVEIPHYGQRVTL